MARNTPSPIQQFRGTADKLDAYTGPVGELTVDTTDKTVRVQDGSTQGGHPLVNTTTAQSVSGVKTFSASPAAPTPVSTSSDTTAATTAFVTGAIADIDIDDMPKASKTDLGFMQVGEGLHVNNGVIGLGETIKPMILSPSSGASVPSAGFTVTATPFRTSYISDTHVSTRWMIIKDSTIVADVTSSTDLTSHTFTAAELSGVTAGAHLIQVQYEGAIAGKSEFSNTVDITITVASVDQPTITAPMNNSDVIIQAGITVSTSAFSVTGGTDTHLNTDYKITSDVAGDVIVAQALASSDKTSHTFPASALSGLSAGTQYYIFARHRGTTLGESPWSSSVKVTAKSGQVAPGDRTVYRHANNKGSVIEYNEFGTPKKLFVADAAYRGTAQWKTTNAAVSGLKQWNHYYYPTCTGNVIDSSTGYVSLNTVADLTPYSAKLSDAHFQAALTATLASVIQTAKAATDLMIADGNCPAAQFVRGKTSAVGIEMQLPNIYQLLVMFACGDIIDSLDPTLAANPTYALGWNGGKNTYRWYLGGASNAWSSTEHSATYACNVNYTGTTYNFTKTITRGVAPVAEI